MKHDRFHGRVNGSQRPCDWPGCPEKGEFRAPGVRASGFDGPGDYRWFCLDHIREFNAGYDFFDGMSSDEILAAHSPLHGWDRESRTFRPDAGAGQSPRWADFTDPLDAIGAHMRARANMGAGVSSAAAGLRQDGRLVTSEERRALDVLGLPLDADRRALRTRYSELVHRFHPDRNGGDRRHETQLQAVVSAWQVLKKAAAFV
jgi:hypothetical protein